MIRKLTLSVASIVLLSGCTVGPDFKAPNFETGAWINQSAVQDEVNTQWWTVFNDPVLEDLIQKVTDDNLDIRIATARIAESRAARTIDRASLLPSLGSRGSYSAAQASTNDIGAAPIFFNNGLAERRQDFYEAGFDASWEIDLFGGNQRALEAATARLGSAEALRRDVVMSVLAETARNYIGLRGAQKRLALLEKNTDLQIQTVDLVKKQSEIGIAREVDLTRAQAQLENTRAQIPNIEAQIRNASYRLAVLTGQQPGALF